MTSCISDPGCRVPAEPAAVVGKAYRHARTAPGLRFERHAAAVQLHQALDDRQPEPGAAVFGALTAAFETFKHPRLLLLRDAHAAVLDHEGGHAGLAPSLDRDRVAGLGEADGV